MAVLQVGSQLAPLGTGIADRFDHGTFREWAFLVFDQGLLAPFIRVFRDILRFRIPCGVVEPTYDSLSGHRWVLHVSPEGGGYLKNPEKVFGRFSGGRHHNVWTMTMVDHGSTTAPCRVTVVGAGTMGRNIALNLLLHGYEVRVFDSAVTAITCLLAHMERGVAMMQQAGLLVEVPPWRDQFKFHQSCADALANTDLVIEAIPECLDAKRELYQEIEKHVSEETILASNTSSFMPSLLAEGLQYPDRFLVLHYWNPADLIPLVEIVPHAATRTEVVDIATQLLRRCGKIPIVLRREVSGFIGNRLAFALQREAMYLVDQGIASPEDIDMVVRAGFGRRVMAGGVFGTADLGGLDVYHAICQSLFSDLSDQKGPSRKLAELVAAHRLGLKTGEGWYRYDPKTASALKSAVETELVRWAKIDRDKSDQAGSIEHETSM